MSTPDCTAVLGPLATTSEPHTYPVHPTRRAHSPSRLGCREAGLRPGGLPSVDGMTSRPSPTLSEGCRPRPEWRWRAGAGTCAGRDGRVRSPRALAGAALGRLSGSQPQLRSQWALAQVASDLVARQRLRLPLCVIWMPSSRPTTFAGSIPTNSTGTSPAQWGGVRSGRRCGCGTGGPGAVVVGLTAVHRAGPGCRFADR